MLATEVNVSALSLDDPGACVPARGDRRGLWIYNDSTAAIYVKLGSAASPTDFSVKVEPGDLLELPDPVFSGPVFVAGTPGSGTARATDLW